ncbi:phosphoribosylformylglycinamidine cyclo-ligase [Candidatus Micrarchaeota archaeon]|nr:MAG: phosphoribosylformylglycinamidine cyclo-ligase [Candidatus Micrarchaeota archaeon]
MTFTYSKAGVNVRRVKQMHLKVERMLRSTHDSSILPIHGHYAGLLKVGKEAVAMHTDGVGTKVLIAQKLHKYDTVGIDCVAMNVNDIICLGARPIALVDYLALERADPRLVQKLMKGLVKGAREAQCPVIGGETAIMGDVIKGEVSCTGFDLAATCIGSMEGRKPITGRAMKPGNDVIGLASSGIHSNGLTLARKVLKSRRWLRELLKPTRIYVSPVMEMVEKLEVHGIAHITGGAFSKLSRIADYARVGFELDAMPKPQPVFNAIQRATKLSEREMYRTFNMGVGMCIVVPKKHSLPALRIAKRHKFKASVIGRITGRKGIRVNGLQLD